MKFILALLFVFMFTETNAQANKHALIFAIGDYPKSGGWSKISSANDVPVIKTALINQQFPEKNIRVVMDEQATRAGIQQALEDLISSASIKEGDVVLIHFSSHGQQVADDNGDETDGYDESIVSYDAVLPNLSRSYEKDQANYFRDDEFGILVNRIRSKLGPKGDVVVIMDACHSGSGTRGTAQVRGGVAPFVPAGFDAAKYDKGDLAGVFKEKEADVKEDAKLATYIVFSASRAEELNYETKDEIGTSLGSLTYAMSKALANLDEGTSYRSLFAKVLSIMNSKVPNQNPVLEGNGTDRALFGGAFIAQKPYVEIKSFAGNKINVKAGLLAGLDVGAQVEVYKAGTADPTKEEAKKLLLATGKVSQAGNYAAEVSLDKDLAIGQAADAWVFVTSPVFKMNPIILEVLSSKTRGNVSVVFSDAEAQKIKTAFSDFPLVSFSGSPDLQLIKGNDNDELRITANGYGFEHIASNDINGLKEAIQRFAQYKLLHNEVKNPDINFEVILVPVINGKPDTNLIQSKIVHGAYEFKEGDVVALWVKNNGNRSVYFNILDLQPDGVINPILPNFKQEIYARDLKVPPGASIVGYKNYNLTIFPPHGLELFKVFVSFDEINMEMIASTKGSNSRGNFNSFEALVKNSFSTRGAEGKVKTSEGSAFNVPFRIVK